MRSHDELGQSSLLLLLALAAGIFFSVGLARLGAATIDSARAATAADSAALAGALDGRQQASTAARLNGAQLLAVTELGSEVSVLVSVNGANATSRARRVVTSSADRNGLSSEMLAAIARAEGLLGESLPIVSGYRSRASQQRLWEARFTNPYPVARPGSSSHETGNAIDIERAFVPRLRQIAAIAGLCHPLPIRDPIHFVLCLTPQK